MAVDVYESMKAGDFGKCDAETESFKEKCHSLFPYTKAFFPPTLNNVTDNTPIAVGEDKLETPMANGDS